MTDTPITLREKLATPDVIAVAADEADGWGAWVGYVLANTVILTALTVLPLVWLYMRPDNYFTEAIMMGLVALWALVAWIAPRQRIAHVQQYRTGHFLLQDDPYGFMGDLRLDAKTVIFDGSNLYHFGMANDLGAKPVALIAQQLRAEGYRIICYFDANIFYTMIENADHPAGRLHMKETLYDVFGLHRNEIYIVPSGVQADKYILSTLKHLPISFAVTNDQFRDYVRSYGDVMKGSRWRKGIAVKGNEIRLTGHRFKSPVRLKMAA